MCYSIKCGGSLHGATILALTASHALQQIEELRAIGVHAIAILKQDERSLTMFEVRMFAVDRPIKTWLHHARRTAVSA